MKSALALLALITCGHDAAAPPSQPPPPAAPVTPVVPAAAAPIALTAAARDGVLTLTLRNTGAAPADVATSVTGGSLPHVDWLTVELDDGHATRTLRFVDDRDHSAVVTATLAPGATTAVAVDLVRWSIRASNGAPLAPATYAVRATWDATAATAGAHFTATATTTLTVTAPATASCEHAGYQDPPNAQLALLAHQAPGGRAMAYVGLYNPGPVAVCVYTRIQTHEVQNDWLTILYADGNKYHHFSRVIALDDARDKSYPVSVLLAPGQADWQIIDVAAWAARDRNGHEPLPAGSLYTQAAYDSSKTTWAWSGKLLSEAFELRVP